MKDRATLVDLGLAFAAVFVTTLAIWPRTEESQLVRYHLGDDQWETYRIATSDPTLRSLQTKVERIQTPEAYPSYAAAKWRKSLAEFYTQTPTTASLSDQVATASFEVAPEKEQTASVDQADFTVSEANVASPSDTNYWESVKSSAEQSMAAVEHRAAITPIVFGDVVSPTWPTHAFHFAFLLGIGAACGYMHWRRTVPVLPNASLSDQPVPVLARMGTFAGLIAFAMICSIAVWM
ncbi:MAG: hypothetical protein AAFN70_18720 [Planctomycetota bacterium]